MIMANDPNDEATSRQIEKIYYLVETRRITRKTASDIIEMLLNEPEPSNGLEMFKKIVRPS